MRELLVLFQMLNQFKLLNHNVSHVLLNTNNKLLFTWTWIKLNLQDAATNPKMKLLQVQLLLSPPHFQCNKYSHTNLFKKNQPNTNFNVDPPTLISIPSSIKTFFSGSNISPPKVLPLVLPTSTK